MPSRQCGVCNALVPSAEFKAHLAEHRGKTRNGSTTAWRKLREQILERDGHRCTVCGSTVRLEVHHVDWDASNNAPSNLQTRCFQHNPRGALNSRRIPAVGDRLV